jgi:hypothetical protein
MERKIIILLTLILIGIGVTNCDKTIKPTIDPTPKETPVVVNTAPQDEPTV